MHDSEIATLLRESLWLTVELAGPPLGVALLIGTVMSLVQAVTQINEQTLSFLPKVAAIFATLLLMGASMMTALTDFSHLIMDRIISLGSS
jgi:flagellar biosynthesis protein FliQ